MFIFVSFRKKCAAARLALMRELLGKIRKAAECAQLLQTAAVTLRSGTGHRCRPRRLVRVFILCRIELMGTAFERVPPTRRQRSDVESVGYQQCVECLESIGGGDTPCLCTTYIVGGLEHCAIIEYCCA